MPRRPLGTVPLAALLLAFGCAAPARDDDDDPDRDAIGLGGPWTWPEGGRDPFAGRPWRPPGTRPGGTVEDPIPFGFWGLNGYQDEDGLADLQARFGMGVFQTASSDPAWVVGTLLPLAQDAGVQVTLRLTGGPSHYTDADGDFDLAAWSAMLGAWEGADLAPYLADGTLTGHMVLDDIFNFAGRDPTGDELDEMARQSKDLFPTLPTFVRNQASTLPVPSGGRYRHLDGAVNQFKASYGDAAAYAATQEAAAADLDLGIIHGLNIANGGDGSSGQPGWEAGRYAMGAEEIRSYGEALAASPGLSLFLCWEYDGEETWSDGSVGADWFDAPAQQAALAELADRLATRTRTPLLRD